MRAPRLTRSVALASVAVAAPLWAACGSSGTGSPSGGAAQAAAPAALCQTLTGVFSDGPDPDADPVGYALSQILPLGQIHTSDQAVASPVAALIAADQQLVNTKGSDPAAATSIKRADAALNKACPGVAS